MISFDWGSLVAFPVRRANQVTGQALLFPRGAYGSPNYISSVGLLLLGSGPCFFQL